jgi:hypothetical protein
VTPQTETGEYQGIRFFRSASQPEVFFFLPKSPGPEKDHLGRPTLLLVNTGNSSSLQLGTRWEAEGQALEDLRAYLGSQFHLNPALVQLRPAQLQIESVTLDLGNGQGTVQELQRSKSSGFAPLSAIFQANLDAEQSSRAISALNGRKGFLSLTWRGKLAVPGAAPVPVEETTDVSDWFTSGSGLDHMMMAGGTSLASAAPTASPVEIVCGFDTAGAPVAMVEIKSTVGSTRLTPPRLAPARLDATPGEQLGVKTTYTTGGAPYETRTDAVAGRTCTLTPAHLGLAMITVDATARKRAGAVSAQIQIRYTPQEGGIADETVLRFRYGDWTSVWFVISRSPNLNGSLEYSLKEVAADGAVTAQPPVKTDNCNLQL